MINPDNGYLKAQRAYDAMLPDQQELEEDEENSRREAYEDYLERKADEAREETLIERMEQQRKLNPSSDKYSGLGECKENE